METHRNFVYKILRNTEQEVIRQKEQLAQGATDTYVTLFNAIDEGFCVIELIYDDRSEQPVDWRYLEANPTFERQSGLVAPGKISSEPIGKAEAFWLEIYGRIAETGEPERIENRVETLDRWYSVFASHIGGAGGGRTRPRRSRLARIGSEIPHAVRGD